MCRHGGEERGTARTHEVQLADLLCGNDFNDRATMKPPKEKVLPSKGTFHQLPMSMTLNGVHHCDGHVSYGYEPFKL